MLKIFFGRERSIANDDPWDAVPGDGPKLTVSGHLKDIFSIQRGMMKILT